VQVCDQFEAATRLAAGAGFDLLQLNMAHGYLLSSFLSPLANRREDAYGGSAENRLRFPLRLFDRVRAAWPASRPLSVALNGSDWARGGLELEDAVVIAAALKAHGCDLLEVRAGQIAPGGRPGFGAGFLTQLSETIRHEAGMPTLVGGYLTTSGQINTILAAGRADLCILTAPRPEESADFDR
jgi:anthraniloyl-CoA monooxygenase